MAQALKVVAAVAVAAAVAGGGWWFSQHGGKGAAGGYLNEIPAESLFYLGSLEAAPREMYGTSAGAMNVYRDTLILAYHQYRAKSLAKETEAEEWGAEEEGLPEEDGAQSSDTAATEPVSEPQEQPQMSDGAEQLMMQLLSDLMTTLGDYDSQVVPMNKAAPGAIFVVGAVPVLRFDADSKALIAYFDALGKRFDVKVKRSALQGVDYLDMELIPGDEGLSMLVVTTPGRSRITFWTPKLSPSMLALVVGTELPKESLADSGAIDEMRQQLKLTPYSVARINLAEIARLLVAPQETLIGQQLTAMTGEEGASEFKAWQSPACVTEVMALANQMPVFGGGVTKAVTQDGGVAYETHAVLQLTNAEVRKQLARIQGYVPTVFDTLGNPTPWFGFGYGINTRELAPALQSLWGLFTAGNYSCAPLEEMRLSATEVNPAMVAAGTAMVNGLKGAYGLINKVELDAANSEMPVKGIDALVGVAAINPRTLWNTTAGFNPLHATLKWPADDQPVQVQLPEGWPTDWPLWFKVKGEHAIFYIGEQAAQQSQTIANEKVETNGFFAFVTDFAAIMDAVDEQKVMDTVMDADADAGDCAFKATMDQMLLGDLRAKQTQRMAMGDLGLHATASMQLPPAQSQGQQAHHEIKGAYTTYTLGAGCQPEADGHEEMSASGVSDYSAEDAASGCVHYQTTGKWQRQGNVLVWDYEQERSVEQGDCAIADAPWTTDMSEPVQACLMYNQNAEGFDCLFDDGEEPFVMRYRLNQG